MYAEVTMKRHLPLLLALTSLLLSLPLLFRAIGGHPLIPGAASYEELLSPGSLFNPYGYLHLLGDWQILVSFLMGLCSAFLLYLIATREFRSKESRYLPFLFVCNPLFIALFTSLSPMTLIVPLLLLLVWKRGALPYALLLAILSPVTALLALPPYLKKRRTLFPLFLALLLAVLDGNPFHHPTMPVVEFGAVGVSLFFLSLALIEGVLRWNAAKQRALFSWWLFLLLLAPVLTEALILAGLGAANFAALFLKRLLRRKWLLEETRAISLLLILCSFLFLIVSQSMLVATAAPSAELVATLERAEGDIIVPPSYELITRYFSLATPVQCDACPLYHAWRLEEVNLTKKQIS
jgi:hypothetical protein